MNTVSRILVKKRMAKSISKVFCVISALSVATLLVMGGMAYYVFCSEHKVVDNTPRNYYDLSADVQGLLFPEAKNIYRASLKNSDTSEQYFRFDVEKMDMSKVEDWLFSYSQAEDLKKVQVGGQAAAIPAAQKLDSLVWWRIPSESEGVSYQFTSPDKSRKAVRAYVDPEAGRVWVKWQRKQTN